MPNLIRRSTSYELVTEVRLVLRGGIVLVEAVMTDSTRREEQTYVVVALSLIGIVVEPTHGDDLCKACRSGNE